MPKSKTWRDQAFLGIFCMIQPDRLLISGNINVPDNQVILKQQQQERAIRLDKRVMKAGGKWKIQTKTRNKYS